MNAAQFFLHQQAQRLSSSCRCAISLVRIAKTMPEVVRAAHVSVPPALRSAKRFDPEYRRLLSVVESRLRDLLQQQLETLTATQTEAECKALLGRYRSFDWNALRGDHAALLQLAEREVRRILPTKLRVLTVASTTATVEYEQ